MGSFELKVPKNNKIRKKKNKKNRTSFLNSFIRTCFMALVWGIMLGGLFLLWFAQDLPDIKQLQGGERRPSVIIQTEDGSVIGSYGDLHEEVIKVQDLPPHVPQALIAVEDRRFYSHFGIDIIGLVRAFARNYKAGRVVQGGSTITQQLAKNFLFTQGIFPHNDRSYKRKIQEVLLAFWLEWTFTKDQIMTIYLNRVYLGTGTYGIEAAAQRYFQKSAREMSVFDAALIAGLLQAPSRYSPANNVARSTKRARVVLELMKEAGFIRDYKAYLSEGIKELEQLTLREEKGCRYFTDWIYDSIPDYVGALDRDLIVVTTLNPKAQHHAEHVVHHYLETLGTELKVSEASFVAMRPDGAIVSMVGGRSYGHSQFNRVTQALRQPGSAFKPFVYLAAIEDGMTPETMIEDTLVKIGSWEPKNYKYVSQGEVPLAWGLIKSVNSVTIRVAQAVGPQKIIDLVNRLGISSDMTPSLSLCLGTMELSLLELVSAFSVFANKGCPVWTYGVIEIRDKKGKILYSRKPHEDLPIIKEDHLNTMLHMLKRVVKEGTARRCNIDDTMMGKTGSNGDRDAYFIGYRGGEFNDDDISQGIKDVTFGAWVGNDNNRDMNKKSLGSNMPLKIAKAFLLGAIPAEDLKQNIPQDNKKTETQKASVKKEEKQKSNMKIKKTDKQNIEITKTKEEKRENESRTKKEIVKKTTSPTTLESLLN